MLDDRNARHNDTACTTSGEPQAATQHKPNLNGTSLIVGLDAEPHLPLKDGEYVDDLGGEPPAPTTSALPSSAKWIILITAFVDMLGFSM